MLLGRASVIITGWGNSSKAQYTEKQVNQILSRLHEDTAQLRRGLVAYQLMARDTAVGSGKYWRLE